MKNALIYLVIYFFFSCINRTEEFRKVDEEENLCILLSRSLNSENIDNQFIGYLLCINRAREKYQEIDDREDIFHINKN
ncbi:MAG: hypothetical protein IPO06_09420 [Leptospiraceae bacterium]|nr:hypothetical protein [Leptospiraceae bacterium]MBK9499561.1 hypothetical protein [Leptospiraceae bacterium]MBP6740974.1 hypothetical protein [Leptospiraceae bacterium]